MRYSLTILQAECCVCWKCGQLYWMRSTCAPAVSTRRRTKGVLAWSRDQPTGASSLKALRCQPAQLPFSKAIWHVKRAHMHVDCDCAIGTTKLLSVAAEPNADVLWHLETC